MILLGHIIVAIGSIVWSGYTFFAPSAVKLRASYVLIAITLASGSYLILNLRTSSVRSCLSGLAYVLPVSLETFAVRRRLARVTVQL